MAQSSPGTPTEHKEPLAQKGQSATSVVRETVNGDASDIEDPNAEYVRLKLRITDLTGNRRRNDEFADEEFLRKLRTRLENVKKNYFFSEKDAEASFLEKRREADEALLLARLRGEVAPAVKPSKQEKMEISKPPEKPGETHPSDDVFDGLPDEDSEGGMFGILEPMPATVTSIEGTTITVRDIALPKQWAGRTPRLLLQELVLKSDRFAVITYNDLSGGSRAKRASVHVRWTGGRASDWLMKDIACYDLVQAEQFVATVALHDLSHPSDEGFSSSSAGSKGAQGYYKHLPPVFRDLWNELEVKRKEDEDRVNRDIWASLNSILDYRLSGVQKVCRLCGDHPIVHGL